MTFIRSVPELADFLTQQGTSLEECGLEYLATWEHPFPLRIPYFYAKLIDWKNPQDPLRRIAVPSKEEEQVQAYELADPIGDGQREAVPGLIHRYPDRCLLLLTTFCHIHCRFCFRREVVSRVRPVDFVKIREYLQKHQEVTEVIFSGGDPFTYPLAFLRSLREQLGTVEHIKIWRFHTRIPAIDPESITDAWLRELFAFPGQKVVVVHIDHPREITPEMIGLIQKLRAKDCLVLSPTVLLKGVNNDRETLAELFKGLASIGIKPYYLHHPDRAQGTHHFRVSITEGKALYQSLRGQITGIALPEYILDLPGGYGKVPISWLQQKDERTYVAHTFEGKRIEYTDFAEA